MLNALSRPAAPHTHELRIVADGFTGVNQCGFVLQSATFATERYPTESMNFWSLPKDFHTCGKSCGKSRIFVFHACFGLIHCGFPGGETARRLKQQVSTSPLLPAAR
jgi:hypothetical protein